MYKRDAERAARDDLGNRMKEYERVESARRLLARLPVCARIDGKGFSRFTEGLRRPYDERLGQLFVETTARLVEESGALAGYTQSDEISLLWYEEDPKAQVFLDRRVQKLVSVLASTATSCFNDRRAAALPEKASEAARFDCRVWSVPTRDEAANAFLWRERDATKNSVGSAARTRYSHDELHGRSGAELQEMLFKAGVNWNDYPTHFKRGTFVLRRAATRPFRAAVPEDLPPLHAAHADRELAVTRVEVRPVEMPPFDRVANRVGVLFDAEEPRLYTEPTETRGA